LKIISPDPVGVFTFNAESQGGEVAFIDGHALVDDEESSVRKRIVDVAETWLGTPFHDNQGLKHHGVDCAHLVAKVYEEAGCIPHVDLPRYSPQIYLHKLGDRSYLDKILEYAREISLSDVKPGDVVLYKVAKSFTHGAIIERWPDCIIHPIRPHGVICSAAFEGFVARREHRFFSFFV